MCLVYCFKMFFDLFFNMEVKKFEWCKVGIKLMIKNLILFFYYFYSIQIGGKEVKLEVNLVVLMIIKEVMLKENISVFSIIWKIVNDYGGVGLFYFLLL